MHVKVEMSQIKLHLHLSMDKRPGGQGMWECWKVLVSSIYFHLLQELSSEYLWGACIDGILRDPTIEDSIVVLEIAKFIQPLNFSPLCIRHVFSFSPFVSSTLFSRLLDWTFESFYYLLKKIKLLILYWNITD